MTETAAPSRPAAPHDTPTNPVRRVVVWLTIGSFSIAALMGIIALLGGGPFGEREGQVLLTTLVVGCTSVAMLCYLATAGSRFQVVGAVGGVAVLLPASLALLLIWNSDAWDTEVALKTFGIGLTVALTLAQLSLLLGVAGDRRRLQLVLWPTVALAVGLAGLITTLILTEPQGDGVFRILGIIAILDVLGTLTTLALAVFGNRRPDEPGAAVRVPARLEAALGAAVRESGRSRDDVVTEALEEWLGRR
jgi:hypothetical protein